MMKRFSILLPAFYLTTFALAGPEDDPDFSHSVTSEKKPWTDKDFKNNPDHFQFAILTDRTGGVRPGVFPEAVRKLNEFQPEFVITVGDLIAGRSTKEELREEWKEFNAFLEPFEMPFFYLPGNHDMKDPTGTEVWDELFGVRHYSFVYKDVLFLCLNSQDGENWRPPLIGKPQIEWAKAELEKHPDVRWTMVFIHQPVWLMEEGIVIHRNGKETINQSNTGWPEVEAALAGRKHTVFAGHVHHYVRYHRNDTNYYTLGTTGGGSRLRGVAFGEFDHATWVTMTDDGPRLMNIAIDGMMTEDVHTEAQHDLWRSLYFQEYIKDTFPLEEQTLTLRLKSEFEQPLDGRLNWILPLNQDWKVEPALSNVLLQPGEEKEFIFTISYEGSREDYFPAPRLDTNFIYADSKVHLNHSIPLPIDYLAHTQKHPREAKAGRLMTKPPRIDGDLSDAAWQKAESLPSLLPGNRGGYVNVPTDIRIRHDEENLYFGITCGESQPQNIRAEIQEQDGEVTSDDSIELFFDADRDENFIQVIAVNRAGVVHDRRRSNSSWSSKAEVATGGEGKEWTVELAIPLSSLEADLSQHKNWGFQFVRNRPHAKEVDVWNPGLWDTSYDPAHYGRLVFE